MDTSVDQLFKEREPQQQQQHQQQLATTTIPEESPGKEGEFSHSIRSDPLRPYPLSPNPELNVQLKLLSTFFKKRYCTNISFKLFSIVWLVEPPNAMEL